ncbi:isovaleryl-CoA dehydrogenase [Duganella sp. BJB488]|uniref:isovaleryl-CoA dehydrogenase n=1 Tax=unclassified Duganella TaxID=2636909 RepID=UPI000E345026|nr:MULTISPECIES: isovaleryl-CoA dehydrogenase [unclassified Duganella]RFP21830.1 isovaleryl-CoA dehydrogenase [Duganella sp. BJB489]RFP23624.1 isovaleryl-CoA dehydrogenase [Duganella sp. BJB488]RFP38790.1 isovaleryl-CoA dehydrogenase [Duganella sp. BJB480]
MNPFDTHEVSNTVAPFENVNLYAADPALQEALLREGGAAAAESLHALGAQLGRAEVLDLARLVNQHTPKLHNFDRAGKRVDEVEFHPAWHSLMALLIGNGAHASPWLGGPGAQVARAARYMLFGQVENGSQCPVTMTYASVPALRQAPKIAAKWLPKILSTEYDPRSLPVEQKRGAIIGMGMTEKQGGSDVRSNTTHAEPVPPAEARAMFGEEGEDVYRIVGHKWFFSAPQSDAHLILAQTDDAGSAGLSCFFLPRYLPDGGRNQIRVQRLKDKLGNRSNASSEVEFTGAYGWLIGKPGRGIPTILEMGSHTRLDCVLGSAGTMRAALTHALHHARRRSAFGRPLSEQPLMQNVLADLALESEAATAFGLRLARCFDEGADPAQALLARILTPAGKYWICKRGPAFGAEAMEVIGGSGYVEDGPLARLYRELPVNSIWEGSGNVMCLDLLRAFGKTPAAREALASELALAGESDADYVRYTQALLADLNQPQSDEFGARVLAERVVLAVQAGLLLRHAPACVSSAFIASRLAREPGGAFGRLPAGVDCAAILARALIE